MSLREGFLASQRNMALGGSSYGGNLQNGSQIKNLNQELQSILHQANTYFQLGQTQKMIELCDEGIRKYPSCKELHFNKGYALWKMGHTDLAITCYKRALDTDPEFSPAHNNMGLVYLKNNDIENALKAFERATRGKPAIEDAWLNYAICLTKKDQKREAIAVLNSMAEKFPNNKIPQLYKGHIHREFREIQDAVNSYNRVLALDPQNRDALLSLAVIHTDVKQKSEAVEAYRRLTERYPTDAEVFKMHGYSLKQFGETDKSIAAFRTALNLDPNCVPTMIEQANNYLDKNEAQNALDLYTRVLKIDSNQKESLILKASILADLSHEIQGDVASKALSDSNKREALACLDRAISLDSTNSDAYLLKGLIQKSMGDSEGAITNLGQAISRNSNCSIGYMSRAALYYRGRQLGMAKDDIGRLSSLASQNSKGMVFDGQGSQEEAMQQFLGYFQDSENNLKNFQRNRQDINRFGMIQARNVQKVLFLHAQNFEKKSRDEYRLFVEGMRRLADVDQRNYKIAAGAMPPTSAGTPIDHYRLAFLGMSEIVLEHYRNHYVMIEDIEQPEYNKPLAFIDFPTYAQVVAQQFEGMTGPVYDSALKERSMPIYSFFRGHNMIDRERAAEETTRYLSFFSGRKPSDIEDFTIVNFQKVMNYLATSKEHQNRLDRASSNPDVIDFKKGNFTAQLEDSNHAEFFAEMRSDAHILGLSDALMVRSLMIFYRFKTEVQYQLSCHDEVAKFLLNRSLLFSKAFMFDKLGTPIVRSSNGVVSDAFNPERPIMTIDTDPDRVLNHVEVHKVKFFIHKRYSPFSLNEIVFVFKDFPNKSYIYKQENGSEMPLQTLVFPQKRRTVVEMDIVINKDHKRKAVFSFHNLVEDEVWVVTEVYKVAPSAKPKSLVKLFFKKKGL